MSMDVHETPNIFEIALQEILPQILGNCYHSKCPSEVDFDTHKHPRALVCAFG